MASHRKKRKSRSEDGSTLGGTWGRIVAFAAAIVTITGAISGILGLFDKTKSPEPPEALEARFSAVKAYPEFSLEQYDARAKAEGVITGAPSPVKTGMVVYRLAADTAPAGASSSLAQEGTSKVEPSVSTPTTKAPALTIASPAPVIHSTPVGAKRPGGRITTKVANVPLPAQAQTQPKTSKATPPSRSFHPVAGALVTNGTGAPQKEVNSVLDALSNPGASEAEGEVPSSSPEGAKTTSVPTAGAPAPSPGQGGSGTPAGKVSELPHVVLPKACSSLCGATQVIEMALTDDPNPRRAAEAVAAIFSNSRGEVVGKRIYPIGAMVTYTVSLDGFAHRKATLQWSLLAGGGGHPPPKPWWRDVVVAHIEPVVDHESLAGTFWVPVPPERGDYVVHLELLDAHGTAHASSDSKPDFH